MTHLSWEESALYGTPADRARDLRIKEGAAARRDQKIVARCEQLAADFARLADQTRAACASGIEACHEAILLINESRAARGLPPLPLPEAYQ